MDSILLAKQRPHHQIHHYDLPEVTQPNGWRAIERSSIAIKEKRFIFDDLIMSLKMCVFYIYKDRLHMTFSCWKPISLLFDAEPPTHFIICQSTVDLTTGRWMGHQNTRLRNFKFQLYFSSVKQQNYVFVQILALNRSCSFISGLTDWLGGTVFIWSHWRKESSPYDQMLT